MTVCTPSEVLGTQIMNHAREFSVSDVLKDGTRVTIRAVRPDDRDRFLEAFRLLEKDSIYTRFFSHRNDPSDAQLDRAVNVDFVHHVALVVTTETVRGVAIIASGRYIVTDETSSNRSAEVAFVVEEDYQGRGIASRLLAHLAALARAQSLKHFEAEVLVRTARCSRFSSAADFPCASGGMVASFISPSNWLRTTVRSARSTEGEIMASIPKVENERWDVAWRGFAPGSWQSRVNVREFIQRNYTPYEGDGAFLQGATERTRGMWQTLQPLLAKEREKGILDVSQIPSSILAHEPGYIDKENELIVGLQTDAPLKRAIMPFGGWRVVAASLESYGYKPDERLGEIFTKYRKTHNDGVFDAYTPDIRSARSSGIVTGLPDAYGRGRIIGDYRRVALYGVDFLIADKKREKEELDNRHSTEDVIRLREELSEQIRSLEGAEGDGIALWLRHLRAGEQRSRGGAVDLLRLSRRHQAAERRGNVRRPPVHVLGHLFRAGPSRRHADGVAGPGNHRRPRHQVADRALPARAGVQRAFLRRPGVGDGGGGRDGRGRPHARHQERVSHAAHALQPRTGTRAQPHGVLVAAPARGLQALRDPDVDRYQRDPIRVRRSHAAQIGR